MAKIIEFEKYPRRQCLTVHECYVCRASISYGEMYFDGGYGRRAHTKCVELSPKQHMDAIIAGKVGDVS